jgi:hypothetical protein
LALLALLPVLGVSSLFARLASERVEMALFSAVSSITAIIYLFGLVGLLAPAATVIFWGGAALAVASPFLLRGRSIPASPGLILFVVLSLIQWALFQDAGFFFWDEFSHWGLAAKELVNINRLFDGTGSVQFSHYPPATAVFHYFVAHNVSRSAVSQEFNEFSYPIRGRYPTGFHLSAVGFFVLVVALLVARTLLAARDRAVLWGLAGFATVLFATHSVMLFALYAFIFPEHKAVNLASWVRCMNIVLFPLVMIALAVWLPAGDRFGHREKHAKAAPWVPAAVLLFLYVVETPYLAPLAGNRPRVAVRAQVEQRIAPVKRLVPPGASLYVICPGVSRTTTTNYIAISYC